MGAPAAPKEVVRSGAAVHDRKIVLPVCARHDDRRRRVSTEQTEELAVREPQQLPEHHGMFPAAVCTGSRDTLSEDYNAQAEELRHTEFRRLGSQIYVDHAGATLYSEKQLELAYKVTSLHPSHS